MLRRANFERLSFQPFSCPGSRAFTKIYDIFFSAPGSGAFINIYIYIFENPEDLVLCVSRGGSCIAHTDDARAVGPGSET